MATHNVEPRQTAADHEAATEDNEAAMENPEAANAMASPASPRQIHGSQTSTHEMKCWGAGDVRNQTQNYQNQNQNQLAAVALQ